MSKSLAAILILGLSARAWADVKHTVVQRDTMWDLAQRYYTDNFKWRRISEANPPPNVADPHWIYPGQILIIPDLEAPVESAAMPAAEPAAEPEPDYAPPPAAPPVVFQPRSDNRTTPAPEDNLSVRIPDGLVSSSFRMKALDNWTADGKVIGLDGSEIMAAEGDNIDLEVNGKPRAGDRYTVFRPAAPGEGDDPKGNYVVKVGLVSLRKPLGGKNWRAVILKSNDSLQLGDVVSKE